MPPSSLPPVPADAPALERGVGFFETVLIIGRRPVLWDRHVERLLCGLASVALPAPGRGELEAAAEWALGEVPAGAGAQAALRLSWFAIHPDLDAPESWRLHASLRPIPQATLQRRQGCRAISLPAELARDTPRLKSTSYLAAVLGLRYAQRHGGNEGLFRAADGSYTEGTATTLLAWDGGRLRAAPHPVLPGVTAAAFAAEPPRGALSPALLRDGAIVLGSLTLAAPLLSLDGEPCQLPEPMLERISAFNQRLLAGACDGSLGGAAPLDPIP